MYFVGTGHTCLAIDFSILCRVRNREVRRIEFVSNALRGNFIFRPKYPHVLHHFFSQHLSMKSARNHDEEIGSCQYKLSFEVSLFLRADYIICIN